MRASILFSLLLQAPAGVAGEEVTFANVPLALQLPRGWEGEQSRHPQLLYRAHGKVGPADVDLTLLRLENAFCLADAQQQLEWFFRYVFEVEHHVQDRHVVEQRGFPVAHLGYRLEGHDTHAAVIAALFAFANGGAALLLQVTADQLEPIRRELDELRAAVRITTALPDPAWGDAEVRERMRQVFAHGEEGLRVTRTAHYLVLAESVAGERLGDRLENHYLRFKEFLPFAERPSDRLLPVYLFADQDHYQAFVARHMAMPQAPSGVQSLGHAAQDYYATGTGDPDATVHAHEAAHQLARMRRWLVGGGSWLHEGMATYFAGMAAMPELTASIKQLAARKQLVAWRALMAIPSLITPDAYRQAASMIWFFHVRDVEWPFDDLMARLGEVAPNDVAAIEQVLLDVTGLELDQLEAQWREFVTQQ